MDLSWEQIKPFLSERGALEVELASLRAALALQNQVIARLTSAAETDEQG